MRHTLHHCELSIWILIIIQLVTQMDKVDNAPSPLLAIKELHPWACPTMASGVTLNPSWLRSKDYQRIIGGHCEIFLSSPSARFISLLSFDFPYIVKICLTAFTSGLKKVATPTLCLWSWQPSLGNIELMPTAMDTVIKDEFRTHRTILVQS